MIDLKDIDKYKSFKNGSFIYDLGYYQGNLLVNEIERLNNIINELEKYIKDGFDIYCCNKQTKKTIKSVEIIVKAIILDKLKELKEKNKLNALYGKYVTDKFNDELKENKQCVNKNMEI